MKLEDLAMVLNAVQSKINQQNELYRCTGKQSYLKEAKQFQGLLSRLSQQSVGNPNQ